MKKIFELLKQMFGKDPEKLKEIEGFEKLLDNEDPKPEPQKGKKEGIEELKALIVKQQTENKALADMINEMTSREKKREELTQQQVLKEREEKIKTMIEEATKDGRIPPKNEELITTYKKLLETDFDATKKAIDSLPKNTKPEAGQPQSQQQPTPAAELTRIGQSLRPEIQKYISTVPLSTESEAK